MDEPTLRRILYEEIRNAGMLSTTEGNAPPNDQEAELDVLAYCYDNKLADLDPLEFFSLAELAKWVSAGCQPDALIAEDGKRILDGYRWVSPERFAKSVKRISELHARRRFIRRMRTVEIRLRNDEIDVAKAREMLAKAT